MRKRLRAGNPRRGPSDQDRRVPGKGNLPSWSATTGITAGLGVELLKRLVDIGRDEKLTRIFGDILPENRDMLRVCDKLGFHQKYSAEERVVRAEIAL